MTLVTDTADAPADDLGTKDTLVTDTPEGDDEPKDGPKGDDEPKDGPKGDDEPKDEPAGAPEEYADFTAPEGVVLDAELLDGFKGVAKELNLSQDAAQKLVDQAVAMRQRDAEAIEEIRGQWLDAAKADKEFGGEKLGESLATAKRGLEAYGSPALTQLLNETGLGNHPEIVRLLVNAGKSVSEDKFVAGGSNPGRGTDRASRLYPTSSRQE
jgi:hypothetical protein